MDIRKDRSHHVKQQPPALHSGHANAGRYPYEAAADDVQYRFRLMQSKIQVRYAVTGLTTLFQLYAGFAKFSDKGQRRARQGAKKVGAQWLCVCSTGSGMMMVNS